MIRAIVDDLHHVAGGGGGSAGSVAKSRRAADLYQGITAGGWQWKYDDAARLRAPEDADGIDLDQILDAITCPVMLAYGTGSWVPIPSAERLEA